jgi:hypothetical protein
MRNHLDCAKSSIYTITGAGRQLSGDANLERAITPVCHTERYTRSPRDSTRKLEAESDSGIGGHSLTIR